jgi:hypothetical protein
MRMGENFMTETYDGLQGIRGIQGLTGIQGVTGCSGRIEKQGLMHTASLMDLYKKKATPFFTRLFIWLGFKDRELFE